MHSCPVMHRCSIVNSRVPELHIYIYLHINKFLHTIFFLSQYLPQFWSCTRQKIIRWIEISEVPESTSKFRYLVIVLKLNIPLSLFYMFIIIFQNDRILQGHYLVPTSQPGYRYSDCSGVFVQFLFYLPGPFCYSPYIP